MHYTLTCALLIQASLGLAESTIGDFIAPGRADRIYHKRAPTDFGTFYPDCRGSESACNNACYYIRCQVSVYPKPTHTYT